MYIYTHKYIYIYIYIHNISPARPRPPAAVRRLGRIGFSLSRDRR